jgi:uronate dehydrogenase
MRVLLTGAAGSIGRTLVTGLADRGHEVVGVDLLPAPDGYDGPWHTADCTDVDAVFDVFAATGKVDAVVHLAGIPTESSLPEALTSHVVSTGVLLDAMVAHNVTRIVYASSNHAVGRTPRTDLLDEKAPPRPDTFYGVGKVAAEALLRLYVDRYGVDAVVCRIGSFSERPENTRALSTWLSPDDCVRMVDAAVSAPAPGFAVIYGVSANTRACGISSRAADSATTPPTTPRSSRATCPPRPTTRRTARSWAARSPVRASSGRPSIGPSGVSPTTPRARIACARTRGSGWRDSATAPSPAPPTSRRVATLRHISAGRQSGSASPRSPPGSRTRPRCRGARGRPTCAPSSPSRTSDRGHRRPPRTTSPPRTAARRGDRAGPRRAAGRRRRRQHHAHPGVRPARGRACRSARRGRAGAACFPRDHPGRALACPP